MSKPTREAVEEMLNDFEAHELIGSRRDVYELVVSVFKDWLAQEEELRAVELEKHTMCEAWERQNQVIDKLQTENQALKASMEAEYIERQAKHIQMLVEENMALRAIRAEWQLNLGIVPPDKEGESLRHTTDDATGDEGNEGGQP